MKILVANCNGFCIPPYTKLKTKILTILYFLMFQILTYLIWYMTGWLVRRQRYKGCQETLKRLN